MAAPAGGAFNQRIHCSNRIQQVVGLRTMNCAVPKEGDRTRIGEQGEGIISGRSHMDPFTDAEAQCILNVIPQATKDAPPDANTGFAIAKLAVNARGNIPDGCAPHVPNLNTDDPFNVAFYWSPGSPVEKGKNFGARFISFLYENMDDGSRRPWMDLTGREQFEWNDAWNACNRTHLRNEPMTRGLAGTDDARIPNDAAGVQDVLLRSPTARRRRHAGHALQQNQWDDIARQLRLQF